jgi:hypothetical protein
MRISSLPGLNKNVEIKCRVNIECGQMAVRYNEKSLRRAGIPRPELQGLLCFSMQRGHAGKRCGRNAQITCNQKVQGMFEP